MQLLMIHLLLGQMNHCGGGSVEGGLLRGKARIDDRICAHRFRCGGELRLHRSRGEGVYAVRRAPDRIPATAVLDRFLRLLGICARAAREMAAPDELRENGAAWNLHGMHFDLLLRIGDASSQRCGADVAVPIRMGQRRNRVHRLSASA